MWCNVERMRCATPTCGPARGAILLGRFSPNTGVTSNATTYLQVPWDETFNNWLHDDGVTNLWDGKSVNGWNGTAIPPTADKFTPPGWHEQWLILQEANQYTGFQAHLILADGSFTELTYSGNDEDNYSTDIINTRLTDYINGHSGERFFYFANPFAPHDPFAQANRHLNTNVAPLPVRPSELQADVSTQPQWVQDIPELSSAAYTTATTTSKTKARRTLLATDDMIDDCCEALIAKGIYDQTDIYFATDNGNAFARFKRLTSSVSRAKSAHYPEMSNASCLIKPAVGDPVGVVFVLLDDMPNGWHLDPLCFPKLAARMAAEGTTVIPNSCSTVDITATICARFGVTPPGGIVLDGIDMTPLLLGLDVPWRTGIESYVRHTDAATSFWAGLDTDDGHVYTEHHATVPAVTDPDATPTDVELYLPDDWDAQLNVAGAPEHTATQADLAAELARRKTQTDGQRLHAGRAVIDGNKVPWRVAYGDVFVEALATY